MPHISVTTHIISKPYLACCHADSASRRAYTRRAPSVTIALASLSSVCRRRDTSSSSARCCCSCCCAHNIVNSMHTLSHAHTHVIGRRQCATKQSLMVCVSHCRTHTARRLERTLLQRTRHGPIIIIIIVVVVVVGVVFTNAICCRRRIDSSTTSSNSGGMAVVSALKLAHTATARHVL
jgi:hypothetical protein